MNKAIIITNMETAEEAYQKMFQEYAWAITDDIAVFNLRISSRKYIQFASDGGVLLKYDLYSGGEPLDNPVGVLYRNRKAWNAYERGNSL